MRVLLSTFGSRGDVEPLAGLAVRLRALGAQVRVCAPPDEEFADRLAGVGVSLIPVGQPMRAMVTGTAPLSVADLPGRATGLIARQFGTLAGAARGCDALLTTGRMPAAARAVTEKLGIRYVHACYQPVELPSPHHPPSHPRGRPLPAGLTDNRVLWDLDAQSVNMLFGAAVNAHRASVGLPPVDDVRDYFLTGRPWLAADPVLAPWPEPAGLDVVQTGAWIVPDERPLPAGLAAFLDAGPPPVYVGFGSMPMRGSTDIARVAIAAIRAQDRRAVLSRGWAGLAPVDDRDDCLAIGEVNLQALFGRVAAVVHHGGAGTTTAAALAAAPQVVVPQWGDQPYWAGRVVGLGIGTAHDGPAPTTGSLSAALAQVLTPGTSARAAAVAGAIRTDGAMVAARLLLDAQPRKAAGTRVNHRATAADDAETQAPPSAIVNALCSQ